MTDNNKLHHEISIIANNFNKDLNGSTLEESYTTTRDFITALANPSSDSDSSSSSQNKLEEKETNDCVVKLNNLFQKVERLKNSAQTLINQKYDTIREITHNKTQIEILNTKKLALEQSVDFLNKELELFKQVFKEYPIGLKNENKFEE
jgi:hypothetical protein